EILLDGGVSDDGDASVHDRDDAVAPDQVGIARIVRIDGDGGIPQNRLWPRRGDHDRARLARSFGLTFERLQWIADIGQLAGRILDLDFEIRDGAHAARTPVDDALGAIDQPLLIQADKDLANGARQPIIQREALALPVGGDAQPAVLILDV